MKDEGEYWTFTAECNSKDGLCMDDMDPKICLECRECELTYVPDVLTFTPDFKMED